MTIEELGEMASRWGGDIERWPRDAQEAARALALTPEGRSVLAGERRLDALLARRPDVTAVRTQRATLAVLHRLADHQTKPSWQASLAQHLRDWLVPTASLACSTALGVALALGGPPLVRPVAPEVAAISLILDSTSMLGGIETR
jgi:hypothetical protein